LIFCLAFVKKQTSTCKIFARVFICEKHQNPDEETRHVISTSGFFVASNMITQVLKKVFAYLGWNMEVFFLFGGNDVDLLSRFINILREKNCLKIDYRNIVQKKKRKRVLSES
jgi:hypothetical protein